jgi:hypothetical protein
MDVITKLTGEPVGPSRGTAHGQKEPIKGDRPTIVAMDYPGRAIDQGGLNVQPSFYRGSDSSTLIKNRFIRLKSADGEC